LWKQIFEGLEHT